MATAYHLEALRRQRLLDRAAEAKEKLEATKPKVVFKWQMSCRAVRDNYQCVAIGTDGDNMYSFRKRGSLHHVHSTVIKIPLSVEIV